MKRTPKIEINIICQIGDNVKYHVNGKNYWREQGDLLEYGNL